MYVRLYYVNVGYYRVWHIKLGRDNILYAKLMCWLGYANDRLVYDRVYQDMLSMMILVNITDKGY